MNFEYGVRRLEEAGVQFLLSIPDIGGATTVQCAAEDLRRVAQDPVSVYAAFHGVTVEQYRQWQEAEGSIQCLGTTRSGRRCRAILRGCNGLPAREWLNHPGGYCPIHGG